MWRKASLLTLCFLPAFVVTGRAASCISVYETAPTPVRHAAHRLAGYTAIPLGQATGEAPCIRIDLNAAQNRSIGLQGYVIRSLPEGGITIRGNTAEGAANGVYTFLRTLMIEHRKDPFSHPWNIEEKPQFAVRTMLVAPYRYGASYGFAALSTDRWSFEEWKQYVDLMRLCNMTTLCMASTRMYDPEYPNSWREKWRYEVWKQVMDYCHQVGIRFNWFMFPNLVPEQCFWDHADMRTVIENAWWGNALIWSKGKDVILRSQKYTLDYFRGLDGLELIYNDGGAYFDEPDPAAYFADATRSYRKLMRECGNDANLVYWNWLQDFWSYVATPDALLARNPKFKTIQDDVLPLLPKNVAWLDASMLTLLENFGLAIRERGNPPLREGLLIGKEHGFRTVIDFFWYMNPESALNMFPHPYIRRAIQEAAYARDEIGAQGVEGYRLAPPCRFIDDYVFFRLASDPTLKQEQIVNELAGLLAEKPENQPRVRDAINALERFWSTRKLADIEEAERLLRGLLPEESSKNLLYASNGVTFLTYIVRLAQRGVTEAQKEQLKTELYKTIKPMYIFQGITADIVWTPEAIRFFNARVDMMVEDYLNPLMVYAPRMDVVDRSIYPKATSQPFRLRWPKGGAGESSFEKMMGRQN